jgi:hypothetical protein
MMPSGKPNANFREFTVGDCLKIRDSLSLGSTKWAQAPEEAPFRRLDGHRPTIEKTFGDFSNSLSKLDFIHLAV